MSAPPIPSAIARALDAKDAAERAHLLALRALIFDVAETLPIGPLTETLKWGQPSYTTANPKVATPIRLGTTKDGDVAVLTHCQSTVMSDFRALAPPDMRFDGNRALLLDADKPLPKDAIAPLIRAALTYRL